MPENSDANFPVRAHFRRKDPKTGKSVTYHPDGDDGWSNAKHIFTGDPDSDDVKALQAGWDHNGPLIGYPIPDDADTDDKPAPRRRSTKEN